MFFHYNTKEKLCQDGILHQADAVKMLTATPAGIMGLATKGRIAKGMDADLAIFDKNVRIRTVFVGGEPIGIE